jgi:DNA-binding transcriptional MocR family regulator
VANRLTMAMIETVLALHRRNWSTRRIALELGINRETVARYIAQAGAEAKPAIAPTGSALESEGAKPAKAPTGSGEEPAGSKPAIAPTGSAREVPEQEPASEASLGSGSLCEPFRQVIQHMVALGLTAQRIHLYSDNYLSPPSDNYLSPVKI